MTSNVALEGGPLDGWWYTADDWATARIAAQRMRRNPGQPQGHVLGYRATGRIVQQQRTKKLVLTAAVWRWAGNSPG